MKRILSIESLAQIPGRDLKAWPKLLMHQEKRNREEAPFLSSLIEAMRVTVLDYNDSQLVRLQSDSEGALGYFVDEKGWMDRLEETPPVLPSDQLIEELYGAGASDDDAERYVKFLHVFEARHLQGMREIKRHVVFRNHVDQSCYAPGFGTFSGTAHFRFRFSGRNEWLFGYALTRSVEPEGVQLLGHLLIHKLEAEGFINPRVQIFDLLGTGTTTARVFESDKVRLLASEIQRAKLSLQIAHPALY